jgi:FkbM family methyltransferase
MSEELAIATARAGGVFLDIGANDGCFVERMAARASTVHAFEPHPTCVVNLHNMIAKQQLHNVIVHPLALSDFTGRSKLYEGGCHTISTTWLIENNHAGYDEKKYVDVEVICLDSLALTDVAMAKIDVERSEQHVLLGGRETFMNNPMLIALETHRGIDCEAITHLLHDYGYQIYDGDKKLVEQIITIDQHYLCANYTGW